MNKNGNQAKLVHSVFIVYLFLPIVTNQHMKSLLSHLLYPTSLLG